MAVQIQVKLDTTANPPVTLVPNQVSVNRGNNTIEWTPFSNQSFTFADLGGLPNPPFSGLSVTPNKITIQDNATSGGTYVYSITVNYNGQLYSSNSQNSSSPQMASASTTRVGTHALLGDGSSPTIKNN